MELNKTHSEYSRRVCGVFICKIKAEQFILRVRKRETNWEIYKNGKSKKSFFSYSVLSDSGKKSSVLNLVCLQIENNMSKAGKSVLVMYICNPGRHVKSICVKSCSSEYPFVLQVDVQQWVKRICLHYTKFWNFFICFFCFRKLILSLMHILWLYYVSSTMVDYMFSNRTIS